MKYILVTGGVISGIGKGVISSSIGTLLRCHGLSITSIKIDPYINIDAGTFSPYEHGEVFVLDDGGEVDLDLGNYERFLDITLTSQNNITTGKIYLDVITNERKGNFLGKTVQVIPHITDAIQNWVERVSKIIVDDTNNLPQVCIIELGGTIGDIESMPFVEAFRQFQFKVGKENFCVVHVSLIPQLSNGEQKTKPSQASVRELRGLGLTPDFIVARCINKLRPNVIEKLANFCQVTTNQVLALPDISNIYKVPVILEEQNFVKQLLLNLNIPLSNFSLNSTYYNKWKLIAERAENVKNEVTIVLVGKYTQFEDSYTSIIKALQHASIAANYKIQIKMVESIKLEDDYRLENEDEYQEAWTTIKNADGILVPGGFGDRGIQGKVLAINYARVNQKPLLGICLGMQLSLIEIARNVLGMPNATSSEFLKTHEPSHVLGTNLKGQHSNTHINGTITNNPVENDADIIIKEMPEFNPLNKGGTMRLGKRTTIFKNTQSIHKDASNNRLPYISITRKLYENLDSVEERHRHRYEFNTKYKQQFEDIGLHFVGEDETGERMEIIELEDHPYFVGTQFHPEYKTRPLKPSPVYYGFLLAAIGKLEAVLNDININDLNKVVACNTLINNQQSPGESSEPGSSFLKSDSKTEIATNLPNLESKPSEQNKFSNQTNVNLKLIPSDPVLPTYQINETFPGKFHMVNSDSNILNFHPRYLFSSERMFSPDKILSSSNVMPAVTSLSVSLSP